MIFDWIHRVTSRAPQVVAVIFAALTAGSVFLAAKLRFEGDVTHLLPPNDTALYREVVDRVGGAAELILMLEGDDPAALRAAAEKYRDALEGHPNVKSVEFEARLEGPLPGTVAPLLDRDTMIERMKAVREKMRSSLADAALQEDPLGVKEAAARSAQEQFKGFRFDLSDGALYSTDRKALLIVVSGRAKPHDVVAARSTLEAAKQVQVPVKVTMTGGYVHRVAAEKQVKGDLLGTSIFSFAGVILLFLIGFREWRSLLFAGVPIVVGVVLTLGFTQLVYGRITGLSVVFAAMVVGLGIDFPIQFYNRWRATGDVRDALMSVGPPLVFSAFTTTAVLWALVPSALPAYRELGVLGGTGVLLTLVATLFLCPLLVPGRRSVIAPRVSLLRIGRHAFPLLVLLTVALGIFAAKGVPHEENYLRMAGTPAELADQERVAERFGGTLDAIFFVSRSPREAVALQPKLQALVDAGVFSGVYPAPPFAPRFRTDFRDAVRQAGFREKAFLDYEDWIARRLAQTSEENPFLVSVGMLKERLWLREKRLEVLAKIEETDAEFTGSVVLTQALENAYRSDARRGTLIGMVAVFLLVALHMRHPVRVVLACVPMVVGLVWTTGIMNLTNVRLTPLSVTVFLMIVGIAVDNGIHLVSRAREIGPEAAASELARPMILTSGTTMLSFGTLIFASQGMLRSFGEMVALGVGASLLASLLILPPLLGWIAKR